MVSISEPEILQRFHCSMHTVGGHVTTLTVFQWVGQHMNLEVIVEHGEPDAQHVDAE